MFIKKSFLIEGSRYNINIQYIKEINIFNDESLTYFDYINVILFTLYVFTI